MDVLSSCGFQIEWSSEHQATITKNNVDHILDLTEKSLKKSGEKDNLFDIRGKDKHYYCEVKEKDVILDADTLEDVITAMGCEIFAHTLSSELCLTG